MADEPSNKTEQPTPKRLAEAHEKGNFARAPDLQMVGVLLAAVWSIAVLSRHLVEQTASIAVGIFGHLGTYAVRPEAAGPWAAQAVSTGLRLLLPISGACLLASVLLVASRAGFVSRPRY